MRKGGVTDKEAGPLTGVKVIEMGSLIAGPYAGALLAQFGADVIKIEPPQIGDPLRNGGKWTVIPHFGGTPKVGTRSH
jgi:formyl-CoA transferase